MAEDFIDVQRKFRDLNTDELEDPDQLASLNDFDHIDPFGWEDLLDCSRVVILAEAGSGKTREMQEQAKRLREKGEFGFFVPLESLSTESLDMLLVPDDRQALEGWRTSPQSIGWFFLDAVDELKLTSHRLEAALRRFSNDLGDHMGRARIIISSRPSDWRPAVDLETLEKWLPQKIDVPIPAHLNAEELFLIGLRNGLDLEAHIRVRSDENTSELTRTVSLLPMGENQIRRFIEGNGVDNSEAFLAEIDHKDVWPFARRPLDLLHLINMWRLSRKFGTRAEQHETNVETKLKEANPERNDRAVISTKKEMLGAERLALAMALTRTRTILAPEEPTTIQTDGILDPASILPDWTQLERQTLLRRGLFDPATYGRIRFHHRSVQEFLAAKCLQRLRERGMSIRSVFGVLFANQYGVNVVISSMRPIAAWLAIWDDAVRGEVIRREPEVLLSLGDSGSLDVGTRCELLSAFATAHGGGDSRWLKLSFLDARRIAHGDLAATIRSIWCGGVINTDVHQLLIDIIYQGKLQCCADLVKVSALTVNLPDYHRVISVRSLLAFGYGEFIKEMVVGMVSNPASWPAKVVFSLVADLFPDAISAEELITLMERASDSIRYEWTWREVIQSVDPWADQAILLRKLMVARIVANSDQSRDYWALSTKCGSLPSVLALLCERQIDSSSGRIDEDLLLAYVIARRFWGQESEYSEPGEGSPLKGRLKEDKDLRRDLYWAQLKFMDGLFSRENDRERFDQVQYCSIVDLTRDDRLWLISALGVENGSKRPIALRALVYVTNEDERRGADFLSLRKYIEDDDLLLNTFAQCALPPQRQRVGALKRADRKDRSKIKRFTEWRQWREQLIRDPEGAFSDEGRIESLKRIYKWLAGVSHQTKYSSWNKQLLCKVFSSEVEIYASLAIRNIWRSTSPVLWSERLPGERDVFYDEWMLGMCGVSIELSTGGSTVSLSEEEAQVATKYAAMEVNGFAPFLIELANSHPDVVKEVLGRELKAEVQFSEEGEYVRLLQNLIKAETPILRLLAPQFIEILESMPAVMKEVSTETKNFFLQIHRLPYEIYSELETALLTEECVSRCLIDPRGAMTVIWLRWLLWVDAEQGTDLLLEVLQSDAVDSCTMAIELFGDFSGYNLRSIDHATRVLVLSRLVKIAYAYIRINDDQPHEGGYSPNLRDNAETTRSFFLSTLLEMRGFDAYCAILELADNSDFVHSTDRLRYQAREKAASDADVNISFSPNDVVRLWENLESPPNTSEGLFAVMMDRIADLDHNLKHHDFTDRKTVRTITREEHMQTTLASRFDDKANGAYIVVREEDVADGKKTDIRFSSSNGAHRAVIEVKLADKWKLKDFERALREQLLGQYLRHEKCKAGCLLLTYNGTKDYWIDPITRKHLKFSDVVDYLKIQAKELERNENYRVRLEVFGLDLTDPVLAPAHR